jgi:hypothetical protein
VKKTKFLVCLTAEELEMLRKEARKKGLAVSDLLRRIVDSYFERANG